MVYPISALIVSSSISRLKNAFLSERAFPERARVDTSTLLPPTRGLLGRGGGDRGGPLLDTLSIFGLMDAVNAGVDSAF